MLEAFKIILEKLTWQLLVGLFGLSGICLIFGEKIFKGSRWENEWHLWAILAFTFSGFVLLAFLIQYIAKQLDGGARKGKIHFVSDGYNSGWSKQHDTEMNVRMGGTFTYVGPGRVVILRAFLKGSELAPDLGADVRAIDGSRSRVPTTELWLDSGVAVEATLHLRITPVLGVPGKALQRKVFLIDNLKRQFSLGTIDLPYIGR